MLVLGAAAEMRAGLRQNSAGAATPSPSDASMGPLVRLWPLLDVELLVATIRFGDECLPGSSEQRKCEWPGHQDCRIVHLQSARTDL